MSRMIPPTLHPSIRSKAEQRVFDLLSSGSGTDEWVCLHSLGLARHPSKRRAEIDFLLITRKGVFALEVKGGRVSRRDGAWVFTDRNGNQSVKSEGPFQQASSAMFALEADIQKHFGRDSRIAKLLFGYGVMFPDIVFDSAGCDGDGQITYDLRDRRKSITAYIDRLTQFTQSRQPVPRLAPNTDDAKALVDFLRGDFDLTPPLSVRLDEASERLVQLTEEQYATLDALEEYDRCLIQGGAGTGKTLLAARAARQDARSGKRVLMLCFNRNLAGYLNTALADSSNRERITVDSVHRFMERHIRSSAQLWGEFQSRRAASAERDLFARLYPEYAQLASLEPAFVPYDTLILDEGQDMLTHEMLDAFDTFVGGGLESGRWRVFLDANNQGAVYGAFEQSAFDRLHHFGMTSVLTTNCRNTRQIADETNMLAAPRRPSRAKAEGVPVQYTWCRDGEDQPQCLSRLLERLRIEHVAPGRITVLSPLGDDCCARKLGDRLEPVTSENAAAVVSGTCTTVTYSTISSFKGLENDFVIITDVSDLSTEWWQSVVYVGMSRARVGLHLLLNRKLESVYRERLRQHMERMLPPDDAGEGSGT